MNTVAKVKFVGKNITRSGVVAVESKKDVVDKAHRIVTYKCTDDVKENVGYKINSLEQEEASSQHREALKLDF